MRVLLWGKHFVGEEWKGLGLCGGLVLLQVEIFSFLAAYGVNAVGFLFDNAGALALRCGGISFRCFYYCLLVKDGVYQVLLAVVGLVVCT